MKIAMPYQDGVLLEHFGRAKEFIAPEDLSHAAVARVLKEHGVDVVLCGSIGEHARQAVEGEHMLVFSGITGAADDVLERFLQGNLEAADGDLPQRAAAAAAEEAAPPAGAPAAPAAAEPSASPTSKRAPLPTL